MKKRNKIILGTLVVLWVFGWMAPTPDNIKAEPKPNATKSIKPDKPKDTIIESKIGDEMKFGSCSIILEGYAVYAETEAQRANTDHWVKLGGYYINTFWISPERCWSDEYFEVKVNSNALTSWRNWRNNGGVYTHYLGTLWDGDTRVDVIGKNKTYRYHLRGDWDSIKK